MNKVNLNPRKGFTLIELLIVIVIIGILSGILIAVIDPVRQQNRSRNAAIRSAMQKVGYALNSARSATGRLPYEDEFVVEVENVVPVGTTATDGPLSTDSPPNPNGVIDIQFDFPGVSLPDDCAGGGAEAFGAGNAGDQQCVLQVVSDTLRSGHFRVISKLWEINRTPLDAQDNTYYILDSSDGFYECNNYSGVNPLSVLDTSYTTDADCTRVSEE